jgi:cytochrome b subunit of formate dehydrogenase
MADPKPAAKHAHGTYHERFTLSQRIEHIVLIVSFTTLGVTGLAQKFVGNGLAEGLIALLGGIEIVRIIHRIAAIILAVQSVYHVLVIGHKIWVRRIRMTMLPGLKDLTDAIDVVRYNLGLSREHPRMPRYNFGEKVEYWAMVWGTIIMGITGFMLWNPIATAKFLPGNIIPAAKAAHGAEALLAVLAIIIWHFYNVHVKMLNKSMFTGKMAHHQMEEEHGQELEERLAGHAHRIADPVGIRRRERIYLPVAITAGVLLTAGLLWFATFEETAIATIPPQPTQVPVFSPLPPTPESTELTQVAASLVPHAIEGREACDTCHGLEGMSPYPRDHAGRPNESCTVCHLPGPTPEPGAETEAGGPGAIPANHDLTSDVYKTCETCHGLDKMKPFPENHTAFGPETCTGCHQPAEAAAPAEGAPAGGEPAAEPGGLAAVPHSVTLEVFVDCAKCHGAADAPNPYPENHAGYAADSCTGCHPAPQDETAVTVGAPNPVPHSMTKEIYTDCSTCHAPDVILGIRAPLFHSSYEFTAEACIFCHVAGSEE